MLQSHPLCPCTDTQDATLTQLFVLYISLEVRRRIQSANQVDTNDDIFYDLYHRFTISYTQILSVSTLHTYYTTLFTTCQYPF